MSSNVDIGKQGEKMAVGYLRRRLYKVLETNFTTQAGEIDIIARRGSYVVFVEVKYRSDTSKGLPREAVTQRKQDKIKKTALYYIAQNKLDNVDYRFDVIEILGKKIVHIKNAFE